MVHLSKLGCLVTEIHPYYSHSKQTNSRRCLAFFSFNPHPSAKARVTVNKFREQLFPNYLATLIIFDLPMRATMDFNITNLSVVDVHTQEL